MIHTFFNDVISIIILQFIDVPQFDSTVTVQGDDHLRLCAARHAHPLDGRARPAQLLA